MALSSAWRRVLPLWLLWGAACARAASGDDNAFPFDIEGSSAVGRQDPPETSEPQPRVAPGRLPPAAQVQSPAALRAPAPRRAPLFPLPFTWPRSVQKLEIK
uniref:Laminin subunit alpha 4 n=1 Tax=Microcebus murinus TaxID=30608 RepID=A0A8C5XXJ6_MICMU